MSTIRLLLVALAGVGLIVLAVQVSTRCKPDDQGYYLGGKLNHGCKERGR